MDWAFVATSLATVAVAVSDGSELHAINMVAVALKKTAKINSLVWIPFTGHPNFDARPGVLEPNTAHSDK